MDNLKNELIEMVDIFEYYNIPVDKQMYLITSGVYFEFNRNDRVRLNCFEFAYLLKFCKNINSNFDANKMLRDLNDRRDSNYESLVKLFMEMNKKEKAKSLNKTK